MDALETTNNTDTPESQGSGQLSVEEAFFTSEEQNTGNSETVGTPEVQDTPAGDDSANLNIEQTQQSNDERRYQYWQSEADKMKNENEQLKNEIRKLQISNEK